LRLLYATDKFFDASAKGAEKSFNTWASYVYVAVSVVLLLSFGAFLKTIITVIRNHTAQAIDKIKLVLTNVKGTPFTFLHFVFWNPEIDMNTSTGRQILQHEMVHAKERHTWDKLFIQLVLIPFWCNPFFWIIRNELSTVHEFIADSKSADPENAEQFAAAILASAYPQTFASATSHFFQSSIKRRIRMLTKKQKSGIANVSKLLVIPVIAITVLAFTSKTGEEAITHLKELKSPLVPVPINLPVNDTTPKQYYKGKEVHNITVNEGKETFTIHYTLLFIIRIKPMKPSV
jgi:hypothetical protein